VTVAFAVLTIVIAIAVVTIAIAVLTIVVAIAVVAIVVVVVAIVVIVVTIVVIVVTIVVVVEGDWFFVFIVKDGIVLILVILSGQTARFSEISNPSMRVFAVCGS
jgi:hypothetical protein